jgi:hypothetical protein
MAVAGFNCSIRKAGFAVAISNEVMSSVTPFYSGTTAAFRVTDATRRVLDPDTAWHVKSAGATIAFTNIRWVDFMNGAVQLYSGAEAAATVTFSGGYLPISSTTAVMVEARSFTLSDSRNLLDCSTFSIDTHARISGLRDVSLKVETLSLTTDLADLRTLYEAGTGVVVELGIDTSNASAQFRALTKISAIEVTGSVDDLVTANITFDISWRKVQGLSVLRGAFMGISYGDAFPLNWPNGIQPYPSGTNTQV